MCQGCLWGDNMLDKNEKTNDIEEMVIAIKDGEMDYFEPLFNRFYPLVKKYAQQYYLRYFEYEDLLQEARLAMFDAVKKYDSSKGMHFAGYYRLTLQHHIYGIIRKEGAIKRIGDRNATSLDELIETNPVLQLSFTDYQTPESILQINEAYKTYPSLLSEFEKQVYTFYMQGFSTRAIALELNIDVIRVRNALERCRRKFKLI